MASSTNPMTTFTRASQPPLFGSFFKIAGKCSEEEEWRRQAAGEADHTEHRLQAFGLHRGYQQAPHERADAGERCQCEGQTHQQRSEIAAAARGRVELGEHARGQRNFEGSQ